MSQFSPSETKVAITPITAKPAGMACEAELFLGPDELTKVASSERVPFVSTGASQPVRLPITMPSELGIYHGYINVFVEGLRFLAYKTVEDVVIMECTPGAAECREADLYVCSSQGRWELAEANSPQCIVIPPLDTLLEEIEAGTWTATADELAAIADWPTSDYQAAIDAAYTQTADGAAENEVVWWSAERGYYTAPPEYWEDVPPWSEWQDVPAWEDVPPWSEWQDVPAWEDVPWDKWVWPDWSDYWDNWQDFPPWDDWDNAWDNWDDAPPWDDWDNWVWDNWNDAWDNAPWDNWSDGWNDYR